MSIENIIKTAKGHFVSKVRRIESVHPVKENRTAALILRSTGKESHEERMRALDFLKEQGAAVTVCITGIAASDEEFMKEALAAGWQIISGGFSGRPFSGRKLNAPSDVVQLPSYDAALSDVSRLQDEVHSRYGYTMTAAMPPYGVESIESSINVFDLYDYMDYQYYKGSVYLTEEDGGKLSSMLQADPEALNGQIAVAEIASCGALPEWIRALAEKEYALCPVEALLDISPFHDIGPEESCFEDACKLLKAGYPIACRNNNVYPKPYEIMGDTCTTLCGKEARLSRVDRIHSGKTMMGRYSVNNPYAGPIAWAKENQMKVKFDFPVTSALLGRVLLVAGWDVRFPKLKLQYTRREMIRIFADVLCATADYDPYGVLEEKDTLFESELRKEYGDKVFEELKEEVRANREAHKDDSAPEEKSKKKSLFAGGVFGTPGEEEPEETGKTAEPVKKNDRQIEL